MRTDPQILHDDFGDAIVIEADGILSGERLAAFTEAVDRHAAHLAAIAEGNDDERAL